MLENQNLYLRATEPTDLDILFEWENNPEWWSVTETRQPFSRFILKQYLDSAHLDIYTNKQIRLVIVEKSTELPIGFVDLYDFEPQHHRAGVGILIAPKHKQNLGFATQTLEIVCNYAFEMIEMQQLYAYIDTENAASLQLFSKCGFVQAGVLKQWLRYKKRWIDVAVLQKINN